MSIKIINSSISVRDYTLVKFVVALKKLNLSNSEIETYLKYTEYEDVVVGKVIKEIEMFSECSLCDMFDIYLNKEEYSI